MVQLLDQWERTIMCVGKALRELKKSELLSGQKLTPQSWFQNENTVSARILDTLAYKIRPPIRYS